MSVVREMTLEQARKLLGWTQERLAAEAGEKKSAISDLETGRNENPSYRLVMNTFRALQRGGLRGLDVEDIFKLPTLPSGRVDLPTSAIGVEAAR